jgi:hypothetical protein
MRDPTRTSAPIFGLTAPMALTEEENSRWVASTVDGPAASATLGKGRIHQSAPPTANKPTMRKAMSRFRVRFVTCFP